MGYTLFCVSVIVIIPLAGLVRETFKLSWHDFWNTVTDPLVVSAYKLSFGAAAFAAGINAVFGLLVAWVLVRYPFPGRRVFDALIDFPFALPTAVAGLTFGNLYASDGWLGRIGLNRFFVQPVGALMNLVGIGGTDRSVGAVTIVLVFVGLPFVVRTVQPLLQDLNRDLEQAAASLGASPFYTFRRVILPELFPAWLAGIALALARAIGEYGSVIFVARNQPGSSQIAPMLIISELYGNDGAARATAIAVVLLVASLILLLLINGPAMVGAAKGEFLMATTTPLLAGSLDPAKASDASRTVRYTLTAVAVLFLGLFVIVPIVNVFSQAFSKGGAAYVHVFFPSDAPPPPGLSRRDRREYLRQPEEAAKTWSSIRMTLGVAACAVPINVVFGLAASWLIAKFKFKGRSLLIAVIDLPFSVSPVVAGLIFVLLFGRVGWFGHWAMNLHWQCPSFSWRGFSGHVWPIAYSTTPWTGIIFTPLAMVIATVFITFPFVARNLIPLMEAQGADEELAAATLGAGGWQTFWKVTLPNVKWGSALRRDPLQRPGRWVNSERCRSSAVTMKRRTRSRCVSIDCTTTRTSARPSPSVRSSRCLPSSR